MGGPSRLPRAPSGVHHVLVGPSWTDRGWLGSPRRSISPTPPPTSVPTQPDPEARDTRRAPKPTWRAAHRSTCARRRGPASAGRTSLVPTPTGSPGAFSTLCGSDLSSPQPPPRHIRGDPRRTPQPPPGTRLSPSHHQVKRPNAARPPASRARLPPQHGALERARDCAQALLPSAARARAPLRQQA